MKQIILLILLTFSTAVVAQTANWINVIETNINVENAEPNVGVDIFTNKDGNHIIVQESNVLKYYKMTVNGVAGTPTTMESSTVVSPSICGDLTNIYIVYALGNTIRVKRSTNGGTVWTTSNLSLASNISYIESTFSNGRLHATYQRSNQIWYLRRVGSVWSNEMLVSENENGSSPRIAAWNYNGVDRVYFLYTKSNEARWRYHDIQNNNWGPINTGHTDENISYSGFRVDGSNIVIYFIWYEQDPFQYYFAWIVRDLNNNFINYGNADLSVINWYMHSTSTQNGKSHTVFYYTQLASEEYPDIGLWRSNAGEYFPVDALYEYELPENDIFYLNLSGAGNEVHVIWQDMYGINNGNNLRYLYDDQTPLTPQNLTVNKSSNNHPLLSWTPNPEPDISIYTIYKLDSYGGGWQYVATTYATFYEDPDYIYCTAIPPAQCPDERRISYKINATDVRDHVSDYSNIVNTKLVGGPPSKTSMNDPNSEIPFEYSLSQNYPNPFNPATTINYSIKSAGLVTLKVYDMLGNEVADLINEFREPGNYSVTFNAASLPSGMYVYKLTAGDFVSTKKLILLK